MTSQLIINADDLGMCSAINRACFESFEKKWISSASAMVVGSHFDEIPEYYSDNPQADIGIHLTFTSDSKKLRYRPLSPPSRVRSLLDEEGYFLANLEDFRAKAKPQDVLREGRLQIFKAVKSGLKPTHLNVHMFSLSLRSDLQSMTQSLAKEFRLRIRSEALGRRTHHLLPGIPSAQWVRGYIDILQRLEGGCSELIVHPGHNDRELRALFSADAPWGARWRERDYEALQSTLFKKSIIAQDIQVVGWK